MRRLKPRGSGRDELRPGQSGFDTSNRRHRRKSMKAYYDRDCDPDYLRGKKVAVIGYGAQGYAHANNLKESGCQVIVGLRGDSPSRAQAEGERKSVGEGK